MSTTKIIWDVMSVMVKSDHPIIYQYIMGKSRSRESAVMRLTGLTARIFTGVYDDAKIRSVARSYLKQKEDDYKKGLIKIKPIHS